MYAVQQPPILAVPDGPLHRRHSSHHARRHHHHAQSQGLRPSRSVCRRDRGAPLPLSAGANPPPYVLPRGRPTLVERIPLFGKFGNHGMPPVPPRSVPTPSPSPTRSSSSTSCMMLAPSPHVPHRRSRSRSLCGGENTPLIDLIPDGHGGGASSPPPLLRQRQQHPRYDHHHLHNHHRHGHGHGYGHDDARARSRSLCDEDTPLVHFLPGGAGAGAGARRYASPTLPPPTPPSSPLEHCHRQPCHHAPPPPSPPPPYRCGRPWPRHHYQRFHVERWW